VSVIWRKPVLTYAVSVVSLTASVNSVNKIRDRDWSYTRHVICTNNQCCSVLQHPGEHDSCSPGTWREKHLTMHLRLIFGPNAILGRSDIYSALRMLTS